MNSSSEISVEEKCRNAVVFAGITERSSQDLLREIHQFAVDAGVSPIRLAEIMAQREDGGAG